MELNDLLYIVFAVVMVIITRYLAPYLKTRLEQAGREELVALIEALVQAAEQVYQGVKQGAAKKEYVVASLADQGIVVTPQVDAMIESAVYGLEAAK